MQFGQFVSNPPNAWAALDGYLDPKKGYVAGKLDREKVDD